MTIDFKAFDTREAAGFAVAEAVEQLLRRAIDTKEQAGFVVSGGSSPLKTYQHLSKADLDWGRVKVIPSDERCVKISSDQSNAKMIAAQLLQGKAAAASFHGLVTEKGQALNADELEQLQKEMPGTFDVTLLGMGEDGHIASLFPDALEIEEAIVGNDFCYQLKPDHLKQKRISLSASVLLNSSNIILLIFGERKKQLLELAMNPGDSLDLPVRVILHQQEVPVTVYWSE